MMQTVLAPNTAWPKFTPRPGAPHKVPAPRRARSYCDFYATICEFPGLTVQRLAAKHAMTKQHTGRRINMLIADGLVRVEHIKKPKMQPIATFYMVAQ